MTEIKWIKITTSIFDDEAIKVIEQMPEGDAILVIWFKLLITAGKINDRGLVYFKKDIAFTDETLSVVFNRPINTIRLALTTFEKFGMIEILDSKTLLVINWEKHQSSEKLDLIREQNRKRKQKQREREAEIKQLESVSRNVTRDVTLNVTQCHAVDIEQEEDIDKEREYINSSSINVGKKIFFEEEENIKILSNEEEEILKNFAERADRKIFNYSLWRKKVIETGDYKRIIASEREKNQKGEGVSQRNLRPECQEWKAEVLPEELELTEEERQAFLEKMRKKVGANEKRGKKQ